MKMDLILPIILISITQIDRSNYRVTDSSIFGSRCPETLAQVFSCELCEVSKNFYRIPPVAASKI